MHEQAPGPARRVLLAEDDPFQVEMALFTLEEAGFIVETATDGIEARRKLASVAFDIAILDINLPGVNGLTIVGETRADGPNRTIPIVVVTGQTDSATTLSAYKVGVTSFLPKPVDWLRFAGTINLILRGAEEDAARTAAMANMHYWLARGVKV